MMSSIEQTGNTLMSTPAAPGVLEAFDAVWREEEIHVKRAVLELDEVLVLSDLKRLLRREREHDLL